METLNCKQEKKLDDKEYLSTLKNKIIEDMKKLWIFKNKTK